ncbi:MULTISPECIES: lipopolysaccharide assembly protein LapA domain-containing protein [unclassified Paenibacillus]|uniref:LapA family protein n=1 Tax=unclassified Paenibacillus TaxID=185978 RepID=UPI001AE61621|nr:MULTISPECIES: lipopolysaccharide assembly protein LapA domain-containing protein [unclassified Paenibacillus]MBP1154738.1 putative integral membrane protein [Paenibacillus sp. PvP091]MBP1169878.1 putative integral membrane protein [Paenibacillus sp. PvR098]MBP2440906.1 putative integral membrane protein [Paenibacillus sp. PvP052]
MRAQWILMFALIFALITAIFAVINVEPVRVNFMFTQADIPLILVIIGSTLLGGLIALFIGMMRQFKLQRTIKQLEKRLSESGNGHAAEESKDLSLAQGELEKAALHSTSEDHKA